MTFEPLESRQLLAATLVAGQSVTTGIHTAGVQKNYFINLTKGQAFVIAAGDNGSTNYTSEVDLYAPNGRAIARSVSADGSFIGKVIPVTGQYRIRVRDVNNNGTASVTLTAFYTGGGTITDSDDAGTMSSGRRFAASISPGDLDVWAIPATKGAFINVVENENDNGASIGAGILLVAPDGSGVKSAESEQGVSVPITATQTGTYYAIAYEPGANASGRYGISVAVAPGTQTTEDPDTQTPLKAGVTRTGDLPSGDQDVFQVAIGRGDKVSFSAHRTSSTTTPAFTLVDPHGNVIASSTDASNDSSTQISATGTVSGIYYLVLLNGTTDTGGAYSLTYTRNA